MNKKRKKKKNNKSFKAMIVLLAVFLLIAAGAATYFIGTSPVSKDETIEPFTVGEGSSYSSIGQKLKDEGFIKSELFYKIYVKTKNPDMLYAGKYPLSKSMNLSEIVDLIISGNTYTPDAFYVTFPEGKNMRAVAKIIAENTDNTQEEFFALLSDQAYLDELIAKYWFLSDEIKNPEIYYSLEGYLYPETYQFTGKDMPLKDIIEMMLNQMDDVITPYRQSIEASGYSFHQMLTLASVVELEAGSATDRAGVAGVFYNRLNSGWALGSDVTTYYAAKVDVSERDLYMSEIEAVNAYNTRSNSMAGRLPVSPICNPGVDSIAAAISPRIEGYFYFVADKNGNTYFSYTYDEHNATVQRLKDEGLWFEYE